MHKQRGVTMIGWIFLLIPIAIVGYAGIRVGPEYFNYFKVSKALEDATKNFEEGEQVTPANIKTSLAKLFDVGYIEEPTMEQIDITKGAESGWQIHANWEKTVPLFGNLHLTMLFDKTVVVV